MELLANSVFERSGEGECTRFRLLAIDMASDRCVVIDMTSQKRSVRPHVESCTTLVEDIDRGLYKFVDDSDMRRTLNDNSLSKKERVLRDTRFSCIKPLVSRDGFLWEYASRKRIAGIKEAAVQANVSKVSVYYWLTDYYRYGQTTQALLPKFHHCGGPGKQKKLSDRKTGRPITQPLGSYAIDPGLNTTDTDKKHIKTVIDEFYATDEAPTLEEAYDYFEQRFHEDGVRAAKKGGYEVPILNRRQFVYWAHRLCDWNEVQRKRRTEADYESNFRALDSKVRAHVTGPGERFETDSTPVPVHLVAARNRRDLIGKPEAYFVVDEYSSYITGLHTCLEAPSWRQSAQALTNAFMPKKAFCARYGIEVEENEWPAHHLPQKVLCDRGENISESAEQDCEKLGIILQFPPPFRGDRKPIVERLWKTTADAFWHRLIGTTKSRHRKRGEKDPRLDAALNLQELTTLLIKQVLYLNHHTLIADLVTQEMIEEDIEPTPHNAWRLALKSHAHHLAVVNETQVRGQLMARDKASVTPQGIKFRGTLYSSERAIAEGWYETARREGNWSIEVRFDESWCSEIFARIPETKNLARCTIKQSEGFRADQSFADVRYIDDFIKRKKRSPAKRAAKLELQLETDAIVANAKEEKHNTPPTASKTASVRNIREKRRREIADGQNNEEPHRGTGAPGCQETSSRPDLLDALRAGPKTDE